MLVKTECKPQGEAMKEVSEDEGQFYRTESLRYKRAPFETLLHKKSPFK